MSSPLLALTVRVRVPRRVHMHLIHHTPRQYRPLRRELIVEVVHAEAHEVVGGGPDGRAARVVERLRQVSQGS